MIDGITVTASGPVFNGQAVREIARFLDEAEDKVADEGVNQVRQRLGRVLKHPTGFYQSRITTDRQRDDMVVHDDRVVYGPWLEGVSSRNQTTRFRGYRTFRLTTQKLQRDVPSLAQRILAKYLGRMN